MLKAKRFFLILINKHPVVMLKPHFTKLDLHLFGQFLSLYGWCTIQSELKGAQWSDMSEKLLCNDFGMAECSPEKLRVIIGTYRSASIVVTHFEECGYYIIHTHTFNMHCTPSA